MYGSIHGFSLYKYNDVSYTSSQTKFIFSYYSYFWSFSL